MWTSIMLQHVSDRVCSGINQDGKGTEPVSESDKDFRGLRKIDVLPDE